MKNIVYADNAATTKMSDKAYMAMLCYYKENFGNASQPYAFSRISKKAIQESRKIIADCIGAFPEEIYFTSCGTESDNWALNNAWFQNRKIYTSTIEHHAILNTCAFIANKGGRVEYLPVNNDGHVIIDTLDAGSFLSVMTANNEIGTVQDIELLADFAHKHGAIFHTDAVQAVGHIDIDVHKMGIDMLSASAHKFNGPKGIGFLYVKKDLKFEPLIHGGSQEFGYRAGTENVAYIVACAIALQENVFNLKANEEHVYKLENLLLENLKGLCIPFKRNGKNHMPGIVSLSFEGFSGEALLHRLDLSGICISTGSACDSKNTQISHVLAAIGLPYSLAQGTIRISLGKYNTKEDIISITEALKKIIK